MEGLTGKTILVTGGTGFVGAHLVKKLLTLGNRVIVPYRARDPYSYFFSEALDTRAIMVSCDLKDEKRVYDVVVKHAATHIIHLGAQAIVETAYHNPIETIETNVLGTAYVLEAARRYGKVQAIIVASSDKAYGKKDTAYKETDPLRGDHPYEVSKSATDLIASTYYKTYGVPVSIARFGNIYGPGDLNWNRIVPGMLKAVLTKETLELRSDGTLVRDYVYVDDVVSGYVFMLAHFGKCVGQAFNLSSEESYSVCDLIKKTEKVLAKKIPYKIINSAINEIPYQHLDASKIMSLGWKPSYSVEDGIQLSYKWYSSMVKTIFRHEGGEK